MINRMKKKPLKMKGTELSAAFKRGREVTIKHLTDMMAASCSQSEDRICRRKMMRKKVMTFTGPTVSGHITHSYSLNTLHISEIHLLLPLGFLQHFSCEYCRPLTCWATC